MPKKKPTKGYPYSICAFPLPPNIAKHRHPWGVNRFFQIEALLRSPRVIAAYRQDETHQQFRALLAELGVHANPLIGAHHALLSVDPSAPDEEFDATAAWLGCVKEGVTDLTIVRTHGPSEWWPNGGEAEILQQLRHPDPRFAYYRLDVSRTVSSIRKTLGPLLEEAHKQYQHASAGSPLDSFYKAATPFHNLETWRRYFQCYDLRQMTHCTTSDIADEVYGDDDDDDDDDDNGAVNTKKVDGAMNTTMGAIRRVRKVIRFAEKQSWPPPNVN